MTDDRDPGRTDERLYGRPDDTSANPHEGDGNQGTGAYGENPFDVPDLVDPYADPRGGTPAFGNPAPLKKGNS